MTIRCGIFILITFCLCGNGFARVSAQAVGKIVYMSRASGNDEIYVMNADGTEAIALTQNTAQDTEPAWSPDRASIAFISDRDGSPEVYRMNFDGTDQRRITTDNAYAGEPAWSPDGGTIVYDSQRGGSSQIRAVAAFGGDSVALTPGDFEDVDPDWSPDGRQIAFASNRGGNFEIYRMNADGTDVGIITNIVSGDARTPAWSADGARIAFATGFGRDSEVNIIRVDGTDLSVIAVNGGVFTYSVTWSPDGGSLAYMVLSPQGESYIQISVVNEYALQRVASEAGFPSWASPQAITVMQNTNTSASANDTASAPLSSGFRGTVVEAAYLNVRVGPGPEYAEVGRLTTGDTVILYGRTTSGRWGQIDTNGAQWVNMEFIAVSGSVMDLPVTLVELGGWGPAGARIGVTGSVSQVLRIRGGAGSEFQQLEDPDTVQPGEIVDMVGIDRSGEWFQIDIGGRTGWVLAAYVRLTSGSASQLPVVNGN